jgi:hypothetical protein
MGSPNGGIIGVINPTSFGKCTVTIKTASCSSISLQPGTRVVSTLLVAGGGGGARDRSGGGGGGGVREFQINASGSVSVVIGAGGAAGR